MIGRRNFLVRALAGIWSGGSLLGDSNEKKYLSRTPPRTIPEESDRYESYYDQDEAVEEADLDVYEENAMLKAKIKDLEENELCYGYGAFNSRFIGYGCSTDFFSQFEE